MVFPCLPFLDPGFPRVEPQHEFLLHNHVTTTDQYVNTCNDIYLTLRLEGYW